jgi:hypothetical protein
MEPGPEQVWSRAASDEFEPDVWDAVQAAADQAGVTVGAYIRDAVIARLAAETGRGTQQRQAHRALLARLAAVDTRTEAVALRAQAQQAVRRGRAAARGSADVLASGEALLGSVQASGEALLGNIACVRGLWAAFEAGGVTAVAALVPPDVRWRPLAGGGRVLHRTCGLTEFWGAPGTEMPTPRMFHGRGDDVLVEAESRQDDDTVSTIWLLYRFDGDRLVEAIAFPDEAQAHEYLPPPASA